MTLIYTWNFLAYYLRLQFWTLYYRVFKKAESCLTNSKSLHVANIKEIQSLYCSGLDLEKPLMLSLSPCSKQEVDGCINDFATTFSRNYSHSSLCRYNIRPFLLTLISCICEEHEKMRKRAGPVPHNFWSQKIICFCLKSIYILLRDSSHGCAVTDHFAPRWLLLPVIFSLSKKKNFIAR